MNRFGNNTRYFSDKVEVNITTEVKATIDELNQYLEGNVTREGVLEALISLQKKL